MKEVLKYEKILGEWCLPKDEVLLELSSKRSKLVFRHDITTVEVIVNPYFISMKCLIRKMKGCLVL